MRISGLSRVKEFMLLMKSSCKGSLLQYDVVNHFEIPQDYASLSEKSSLWWSLGASCRSEAERPRCF